MHNCTRTHVIVRIHLCLCACARDICSIQRLSTYWLSSITETMTIMLSAPNRLSCLLRLVRLLWMSCQAKTCQHFDSDNINKNCLYFVVSSIFFKTLVCEGSRWLNRFGASQLLRRLKCPNLVGAVFFNHTRIWKINCKLLLFLLPIAKCGKLRTTRNNSICGYIFRRDDSRTVWQICLLLANRFID